jgi:KH domain-containing protein
MEKIFVKRISEVKKNIELLKEKLEVNITINKNEVSVENEPLTEYEAIKILEAINFGFSANKALLLKEYTKVFNIINIKSISNKKNYRTIRARIIGRYGQTLRVLRDITHSEIILNENELGIISEAEDITIITTALKSLIKGTKQSNVYRFLEKKNKNKK